MADETVKRLNDAILKTTELNAELNELLSVSKPVCWRDVVLKIMNDIKSDIIILNEKHSKLETKNNQLKKDINKYKNREIKYKKALEIIKKSSNNMMNFQKFNKPVNHNFMEATKMPKIGSMFNANKLKINTNLNMNNKKTKPYPRKGSTDMSPTHVHHGPIPMLAKSFNECDPVIKSKPEMFSCNEWTFIALKKPMANSNELNKITKSIKLKSLPEMVFINSHLKLSHHDGLSIDFNAIDALKPCVGMILYI